MKLVAALRLANRDAVNPVSDEVLQVTESRVPSAAFGWIKMLLFAVTAVVSITQVAVDAFVAQENAPDGAAEQETTEGLAAVPTAEQLVVVATSGVVSVPVNVGEASGAHPVHNANICAAVAQLPVTTPAEFVP